MQGRMGEHQVKLSIKREFTPINNMRVDACASGGGNKVIAGINADHSGAPSHEMPGENAVAAAKVEDIQSI